MFFLSVCGIKIIWNVICICEVSYIPTTVCIPPVLFLITLKFSVDAFVVIQT